MTRKEIILIAITLLLCAGLIYIAKDWFGPENIQIGHTFRPNRMPENLKRRLGPAVQTPRALSFFFNTECQLTSIKVVHAAEIATNKYAHPLWELESESNSIASRTITYGVPLRGMRPPVRGDRADPLQSGVKYRLLVEGEDESGSGFEASHDFTFAP